MNKTINNPPFIFATTFDFSVVQPNEGDKQVNDKRGFTGIAYSGEAITGHFYYGSVVFDLSTISVPEKLPALIDHDRNRRCGYVNSHAIDNIKGLSVVGTLLSNDHGKAIATESDEGFPWQMSVHIKPESIEEFKEGTTVTVNNRTFNGPITVFRNSKIIEVSFTATGWDSNTSAVAMSNSDKSMDLNIINNDNNQGLNMDLEQLKQENADLKASNIKLMQANREVEVKQLFSDINRQFKSDDTQVLALLKMPGDGFDVTQAILREQFATQKTIPESVVNHLFHQQAVSGVSTGINLATDSGNALVADAKNRSANMKK